MNRVICPVCKADVALSSLYRHVGTRRCIETCNPQLRTLREQAARHAKREYDRQFVKAHRAARQQLASPHGAMSGSDAFSVAAPAVQAPITVAVATVDVAAAAAVIDLTGDESDLPPSSDVLCPICQGAPVSTVRLLSCAHVMCAECLSLHVAHAMSDDVAARCPICRAVIQV